MDDRPLPSFMQSMCLTCMIERRYFVQDRPIGFTLRGLLKVICPRLRQGISACLESKRMGLCRGSHRRSHGSAMKPPIIRRMPIPTGLDIFGMHVTVAWCRKDSDIADAVADDGRIFGILR
jgi:hypothetical protein